MPFTSARERLILRRLGENLAIIKKNAIAELESRRVIRNVRIIA